MTPKRLRKVVWALITGYIVVFALPGIATAFAEKVKTGEVRVYSYGQRESPMVEPYIDALDCIETKGTTPCDNQDTSQWPHSATIAVKGAQYGETKAVVKLRIEGKGDPIKKSRPQQTILVTDDSGSMQWNDPNNMRFDANKFYVDQLQIPDEIGFVIYADKLPNGQYAELRQPLTTNYQQAKNGMYGNSNGGTPMIYGLRTANDELIPKKKPGFAWAIIHLTDGCYNTGGDPQPQVDRMVNAQILMFNIGLYPDPNSGDKANCEPDLQKWSQQTGGKYYWVQNPADLAQVYKDIAQALSQDTAGTPPKSGAPMITFQLTNDISVVPNTFGGSANNKPTSPAAIVPNNRGLRLEWQAPVKELKIGQNWEVFFQIESFTIGKDIKVNDVSRSYVEYDRYDGSPGGSDKFEQLTVTVNPDIPGIGGAGLAEPPTAPPPPPSGGIPQLIPAPQQIPITYLQNLPLIQSMTQAQMLPIQYLLGSMLGLGIADRVRMKSRIRQGVKIAIAAM